MRLGLVVRPIREGACAWIPSPPQRVIGPAAYYPLEGGGVMKEPPPSLIVAGLANDLEMSLEDGEWHCHGYLEFNN